MKKENPNYMTTQKERLSYWTYFVGQNVYYNITFIYLSAYLAMQGIALWKVSLVLLVVKIWDAVNDPIFGYVFDKVKFKNGLKSLPWLRIAVAFIPVVTIAVFAIPGGFSETGKLIWFAVAYLLWDTIYTLTDVPAYSMLNTMTDNLQERNLLLSVNRVFSGAGYLLCVVVMPLLIGRSYSFAVIVLSILSALTMVPLVIFCKERNYDPTKDEGDFSFRQMFEYLGKNKYLLTYYGGYMATDALKTSAATTLFVSFFLFGSELYSILMTLERYGNSDQKPDGDTVMSIQMYHNDGSLYMGAEYYSLDGSLCYVKTTEGETFTTRWHHITHFMEQVQNYINGEKVMLLT